MRRVAARLALLFRQPRFSRGETRRVGAVVLGGTILAGLPAWLGSYSVSTIRDALVFAIVALSLDFLWGRAHVLSLGHATFFGLGAYGIAVATTRFGLGSAAGSAIGIGLAAAVAAVAGYFLIFAGVRLHFFAIITMALLLIAGQIAVSWSSLTGGDVGILGIPSLQFELAGARVSFAGEHATYYLALGLLLTTLAVLWLAGRANYGKVLAALGMNEFRARTLGHNTSLHLLTVFVVTSALAALAGVLYATASGVVAPDLFSVLLSTEIVVWVAVGGRGTLIGPVLATFVVHRLHLELSSVTTSLWPVVLGTIFVLQVVWLPDGLASLVRPRRRSGPPAPLPAGAGR